MNFCRSAKAGPTGVYLVGLPEYRLKASGWLLILARFTPFITAVLCLLPVCPRGWLSD